MSKHITSRKHHDSFFRKKEHKPEFLESVEYKMCAKKIAYESERIAVKSAEYHSEANNVFLRAYKCKFCKKWHLTKKETGYD